MAKDRKKWILDMLSDAALSFAAYDRKEDEELSTDDIVHAIEDGTVTFQELGEQFGRYVAEHLGYEYNDPEHCE